MMKIAFLILASALRQFLASPDDMVPGTKMRLWGMREKQIDDLLAYLRTFK